MNTCSSEIIVYPMQREGFTALHCACQEGHWKVVQVLVKAGANLDIQILSVCAHLKHNIHKVS